VGPLCHRLFIGNPMPDLAIPAPIQTN